MLVLNHCFLLDHLFHFFCLHVQQIQDGCGSCGHLELEEDLKAQKHGFDLDEFFNLIEILEDELEVKERLSIILSLVCHGCYIVHQNAIDALSLVGTWGLDSAFTM